MSWRRRLVAFLTFIAGLYFLLEFVLPPTVPGQTQKGVFIRGVPTAFTFQTADNGPYTVQSGSNVAFSVLARDPTGKQQAKEQKTREISVGETLTVLVRKFVAGKVQNGVLYDSDGNPVELKPGEGLFGDDGEETSISMEDVGEGTPIKVQVASAKVQSIQWGSATILVSGAPKTYALGPNIAVLKEKRKGSPDELEVYNAQTGDTVVIGHTTYLRDQRDTAAQFNSVLGTLALGMGLLSLGMVNGRKLKKREKEWWVSLAFFASVVVGQAAGVYKYYDPRTLERDFSDTVAFKLIGPVGSTIFSLLAFYLASASYRAFRIKSAEAALMMTTALIVMLGQTPFGMYLTGWMGEQLKFLWLPNMAGWVLRVPNSAVVRGLIFGTMLGGIGTALRYWLNLERSAAMGGDD